MSSVQQSKNKKDSPSAELQTDEIRTIVGSKEQPIWVFAVIHVWSRLSPSTVVGKRSYHNTLDLFRDLSSRMSLESTPSDYHGWIRILRESRRTSLWASVCLWPGHQDAQERSHRESRAKNRAWRWVAIEAGAARLGRLSETKHLVCRTAESHDPTGLSLSWSPNDLSSPVEGMSRRSPRVVPLLLQSCFILPHLAMSVISRAIVGQDPVPQG